MTDGLGRLASVPLREVWTHEARDFTPWLAQPANLALLAETLHLGELREPRTEVPVGSFYIDILAQDAENNVVVIENQFGPTDHTHLGQIMTYLAGQEGHVTVVWIAETFREEHRAAIDWLNASTISGFDFFAVEVEVLRIGTSAPAPRFNIVGKPNSWSRSITRVTRGASDGQLDERQREYVAYWSAFDGFLKDHHAPFKVQQPPPGNYGCGFGIGRSGFWLVALAGMRDNRLSVELQFNDRATSKLAFDALFKDRAALEADFGETLDWLRLDDQIRSKVAVIKTGVRVNDREQWPDQRIPPP